MNQPTNLPLFTQVFNNQNKQWREGQSNVLILALREKYIPTKKHINIASFFKPLHNQNPGPYHQHCRITQQQRKLVGVVSRVYNASGLNGIQGTGWKNISANVTKRLRKPSLVVQTDRLSYARNKDQPVI